MSRPARASHHASPLRYPGGKGKLASYLKGVIRANRLLDCTYVEPFAGGAGAGLALLLHGYVRRVVINDLSRPVYLFWRAVLEQPEAFCRRIWEVELSVDEWKRQREVFRAANDAEAFEIGFATFYLNRTNRSGVLNGGMIGGYAQAGADGLSARFNRAELTARVQRLARQAGRIEVTNLDALQLLAGYRQSKPGQSVLLYIDPPYFAKGRDLYYDYYRPEDHAALRDAVDSLPAQVNWVVSYDNVPEIRALYGRRRRIEYDLSYSVRNGRSGREVMFFSDQLTIGSESLVDVA